MSRDALYRTCVGGVLLALGFGLAPHAGQAAGHRTANFIVQAPTAELARTVAQAAENFRRDLAREWLGQELRNWPAPCPITVQAAPNLPAGGETSFVFERGYPSQWRMRVQGSRERILDSVLPHEVTHTIFATHFGQPLPRWADEGACTTVEHASERQKQQHLLIQFLKTERGIPFRHMFAMRDYPADILPLYSQGYSLARFLIAQGGKPKFIQYLQDGMRSHDWHGTTTRHYGFRNLGDLQLSWLEWVKQGSPETVTQASQDLLVQADRNDHDTRTDPTPSRDATDAHLARNASVSVASNESIYVRHASQAQSGGISQAQRGGISQAQRGGISQAQRGEIITR